jgi:hypothetical protein
VISSVVILAAIVVAGVVMAVLPLWLPWGARLNFLLAATATQQWTGVGGAADGIGLREVVVTGVDGAPGWFAARVQTLHPRERTVELVGTGSRPCIAQLRRWSAAGTRLLLVSDRDGEASLHGPTNDVTGLCVLEEIELGVSR